jgi:hypothetical protein
MAVHKYRSLWPKKKSWDQKLVECLARHPQIIVLAFLMVTFIVLVMVWQVNAQADFLMSYGSG